MEDKFFKKQDVSKLTQEEVKDMNSPTFIK